MTDQTTGSPLQQGLSRFWRNRAAAASTVLLLAFCTIALVWPWLSSYQPRALSNAQFVPPGAAHWLGTDLLGRDMLARVMEGTRISLLIGFVGALVSLVVGVSWGVLSGYLGGWWDALLMRALDLFYSMPAVIFVIVLIAVLEEQTKSLLQNHLPPDAGPYVRMVFLLLGLGAVSWLTVARIVRGEVLSLRTRTFVEASRALGASQCHVLRRHILPNLSGIIIVCVVLNLPAVILYESFLSYLGLGVQPPQASIGTLIAEGAGQINPLRVYWWMVISPAVALCGLLLTLGFIGDGLRDAFERK
jgi:peptide/nickel transport system permease protein/oligopeptide transport system permease protein